MCFQLFVIRFGGVEAVGLLFPSEFFPLSKFKKAEGLIVLLIVRLTTTTHYVLPKQMGECRGMATAKKLQGTDGAI